MRRENRKKSKTDKSISMLIVTSAEKLQKSINSAVKSFGNTPCIYVSLDKGQKNAEKALRAGRVNTKRLFFIDCVETGKSGENVLDIHPTKLHDLEYAIRCFIDAIDGKKFVILDALSTLLIYNNDKKVAEFAKNVIDYASENGVDVIALSPKTKGEELLNEVFNFFDKVKRK